MNQQVQAAYTLWKAAMVTTAGAPSGTARVQDPQTSNRTVSEGIGYGMLITVYMDDKSTFDQLWGYAKSKLSGGLMAWIIDSNGNVQDSHSATDGDEDMAWALLMADKQWGGYSSDAQSLIGNIKSQDTNGNTLKDGDYNGGGNHPDYEAPAYYPAFGWGSSFVQGAYGWLRSVQNMSTGLIPDSVGGSSFGYDACRAPLRVGLDYCWTGSSSAQQFLAPMVAYFAKLPAAQQMLPMPIGGGAGMYPAAALSGPIGVAAMSTTNQTFIDATWRQAYDVTLTNNNGKNYFNTSVGMLGLLAMSGNMFDYTNPPQ